MKSEFMLKLEILKKFVFTYKTQVVWRLNTLEDQNNIFQNLFTVGKSFFLSNYIFPWQISKESCIKNWVEKVLFIKLALDHTNDHTL